MLVVENISVSKGGAILNDVSFSINKGELIGIIGDSGAGKTTLLKSISGLQKLDSGKVAFNGMKLKGPDIKLIPGYDEIQLVHQDFGLEPFHTTEENIKERILHLTKEERDSFVSELLELMELKSHSAKQARYLSGGEKQRLSFARALASNPKLLLLDEPFVHLDQRLKMKVMNYLLELNKRSSISIVLVSHDGSEMVGLVDRILHLESGRVVRDSSTSEMYYQSTSKRQAELMGTINSITLNGKSILFRPNEYILDEKGDLKISFNRFVDTGLIVYNYFQFLESEICLVSSSVMDEVNSIKIAHKS